MARQKSPWRKSRIKLLFHQKDLKSLNIYLRRLLKIILPYSLAEWKMI
jgi:hypothetical protein